MRSEKRLVRPVAAIVIGLVAMAGCSRTPYSVANVAGVVSLDGQPLSGGVISFQPIAPQGSEQVGPGSTGRLDAEGRYRLATIDGAAGAVVGEHIVRIYSRSPESAPVGDSDVKGTPKERVPARFNYASELRYTVKPGGAADADFPLLSEPATGR